MQLSKMNTMDLINLKTKLKKEDAVIVDKLLKQVKLNKNELTRGFEIANSIKTDLQLSSIIKGVLWKRSLKKYLRKNKGL